CRRPRSPRLRTGRAPRCEWPWAFRWWPRREWPSLEVALLLAVLHGGLGDAVIGARLAALGDAGGRDLGDHVGQRLGLGCDRAGAAHVADRAEPDPLLEGLLAGQELHEVGHRVEHPVALEHLALVCEV